MSILTAETRVRAAARPSPSEPDLGRALEATDLSLTPKQHLPTWADLHAEFDRIPKHEGYFIVTTDPETGEKDARLKDFTVDQKWMKRFHAMTQGFRRADYDLGQNLVSSTFTRRDRMKNRITGEMEEIPEGFEDHSFKRKWTTKGRTFGFGACSTAPEERTGHHTVRREPAKLYTPGQWRNDCPTCGYATDRWQRDHIFEGFRVADDCTRCARSFELYRLGRNVA